MAAWGLVEPAFRQSHPSQRAGKKEVPSMLVVMAYKAFVTVSLSSEEHEKESEKQ